MTCEYAERCWRCSYSKYLQQRKSYPNGVPPDRQTLFFEGFATAEMAKTTERKGRVYYGGIYAESMPFPGRNMCPDMAGLGKQQCGEYRKENDNQRKIAERKKVYAQKYPNQTPRVWIARDVKQRVSARDKYTCVYCCKSYSVLRATNIRCQVDHVVPLALGGSNEESNLAFSCAKCNREKGAEVWAKGCRAAR